MYSLSHFLIHIPFLGVLAIIYSAYGILIPQFSIVVVVTSECSGSYWLAGLTIGAGPYIYYNLAIWASLATGQALVIMTSTATADVQIGTPYTHMHAVWIVFVSLALWSNSSAMLTRPPGNAVVTAFFALMFYFGGFFLRRTEVCGCSCAVGDGDRLR